MKRVRVLVLALIVAVSLLAVPARAGEPLLSPRLAGELVERVNWKTVNAVDLESVAGDLAPLLREYGCQRAEQAEYRTQTRWQSRVTVYEMEDRSGAYGAFTLLREKGKPIKAGEAAVFFSGSGSTLYELHRFLFYQGNYLVRVEGLLSPDVTEEWFQHIAGELAGRRKEQASLPSLPDYLPEGRVPGSDHYVLGPLGLARVAPLAPGDWAGFAYGAEVEAARYRRDGSEANLLILNYPTPQIARARLADFQQLFNLNLEGKPTAPVVFGRRKGSLVVLVAGLQSKESAEQLIEQVRFEPQLSWSDPRPEDLATTARGLLNLMLGTALLVLVTLGLSLAFAGLRLGMKVWFPGRFLDKGGDEESLFLDIRPWR
ncbi:MAG TPA: DUF6599 family protein [Candidatus Acidoferrales bacterium]|nr:DUF6599 family protein [Candidatus Acidoferrales bacterium]